VDVLYDELSRASVLPAVSLSGVTVAAFGTREFSTVDLDNIAIACFHRENG